jgi:hypothetical protein
MSYNLGLDAVKHIPESHATELKGGQVIPHTLCLIFLSLYTNL